MLDFSVGTIGAIGDACNDDADASGPVCFIEDLGLRALSGAHPFLNSTLYIFIRKIRSPCFFDDGAKAR